MAILASKATGNFTASTTWNLVDSTSYLLSFNNVTSLTTSYQESTSFTPGAITIDGIAVFGGTRISSPTGTVSVRLAQGGSTVSGTEVTINATDFTNDSLTGGSYGWYLFKFSSPVTLLAATAYTVSAKGSVNSEVALYRDATVANWNRFLRTTTEQAPAAGDVLHIVGERTGQGTGNSFTVTMNSTASTDYGTGTDGSTGLDISKGGTLTYGTTAATNYYLKLSGNLYVYNGGTLNIGTTGTPMPRDSTAVLEFDPVADGGMGLVIYTGSTISFQGQSRTSGKNIYYCKLNTDEAAAQTELGVDTDTGWLSGDEIGIASTSRTSGECEKRTLNENAASNHLDISSGLTYAHSGTSPTQAEVVLLTRNVKFRAASSSIVSYFHIQGQSTVDIDWTEFYYLGENSSGKYGITVDNRGTGTFNMHYSSIHDNEDSGVIAPNSWKHIIFEYNVLYAVPTVAGNYLFTLNSTASSSPTATINYNIFMYSNVTSSYASCALDYLAITTFTNNTMAGLYNGMSGGDNESSTNYAGTVNNIVIHSCSSGGIAMSTAMYWPNQVEWSDFTIWRINTTGWNVNGIWSNFKFTRWTFFGCSGNSINIYGSGILNGCIFTDFASNGDTTFSTTNAIIVSNSNAGMFHCTFYNALFSNVSGIKTAHTVDIALGTSYPGAQCWDVVFLNSKFGAATEISGLSALSDVGAIRSQKHDQTAGLHKTWKRWGTILINTSVYKTTSPSQELQPNNASNKLESGSKKARVNNGATRTFKVWVYKSASYNGNQPRLVLKRNDAIGITADTLLDTMTVAVSNWEELSGTTAAASGDDGVMEVVVDCDGTAGSVYVDDWSVT